MKFLYLSFAQSFLYMLSKCDIRDPGFFPHNFLTNIIPVVINALKKEATQLNMETSTNIMSLTPENVFHFMPDIAFASKPFRQFLRYECAFLLIP